MPSNQYGSVINLILVESLGPLYLWNVYITPSSGLYMEHAPQNDLKFKQDERTLESYQFIET